MGTRSTIRFYETYNDKDEITPLVNVYQQFDGYLEGVGKRLCLWLKNHYLVNGISPNETRGCANGAGCLVAQFIRDFKREVGDLYIYPFEDVKFDWIDYNYEVFIPFVHHSNKKKYCDDVIIRVSNWDEEPFFEGTVNELLEEIKKLEEEEKE